MYLIRSFSFLCSVLPVSLTLNYSHLYSSSQVFLSIFFLLLLIGDRMNCGSLNFNENLRHGTKSMRAIESNSKKMQRKWKRDLRKLKSIVRLSDRSIYSSQFSLHQISTSSWKPNTQDLWTGTLILARLKLSFTATKIPFNEIPFNYVTLWYCIRFHPLLSSSIQFFMKDVCE